MRDPSAVRERVAGLVTVAVPVLTVPVLPLLVTARLGTDAGSVFAAGWLIAVLIGIAGAVVVLRTAGPDGAFRTPVERALTVVVPVVVVVLVGSPWVLSLAGEHYRDTGAGTTIMLALAAVPYTVVLAAVRAATLRGRRAPALAGPAAVLVAAAALGWLLMPAVGVLGAGFGWLAACSVAAVVIALRARIVVTRPGTHDA